VRLVRFQTSIYPTTFEKEEEVLLKGVVMSVPPTFIHLTEIETFAPIMVRVSDIMLVEGSPPLDTECAWNCKVSLRMSHNNDYYHVALVNQTYAQITEAMNVGYTPDYLIP
jgi:hypothetical protein